MGYNHVFITDQDRKGQFSGLNSTDRLVEHAHHYKNGDLCYKSLVKTQPMI